MKTHCFQKMPWSTPSRPQRSAVVSHAVSTADKSKAGIRRILRDPCLQTKLTIGAPDDVYEQEADRVADEVMRMPEPRLQRQAGPEELEMKPLLDIDPTAAARTALGAETKAFTDLARGRTAKAEAPIKFDLPQMVAHSVAVQVGHMLNEGRMVDGRLGSVEQGAVITMTADDELRYVPGDPGFSDSYPHLDELHAEAAARSDVVAASVHTHPTRTLAGSAGDWYNFVSRTLLHGPQAHIIGASNGLVIVAPTIETSRILGELVEERLRQVQTGELEDRRVEGMDDRALAIHVVAQAAQASLGFSSDAIWHQDGPNNMEELAKRYGMVVYRGGLDSQTLHRTE